MIGKFTLETPKNLGIDEKVCLRSKLYYFKCGDDSENKLKGFCRSPSTNIKFEEDKKCLDGEEYQRERNNYFITFT